MADLKKIGAKITLDGEKEYKQALKNITSEQKVLRSEMKLADAQYKASGGSIDSMKQKSKVLTEQIDSQKDKIEVLKEALEKSKEQYGENSDQANSWQIQLNNAEAELTNLNSALDSNEAALKEAQEGAEGAGDAVQDFNKDLSDTENTSKGWGSRLLENLSFTDIINVAKTAMSTISSAASAIYQSMRESTLYADEVLTTAAQKGIDTAIVQTFNYIEDLIDTPASAIEGAMTKITKAMYGAENGSKKYVQAFEKIGVQYKNDDGTLRDANDVFWDTVEALGNIENKSERDGIAMELFGKKAEELTGIINLGRKGFEDYSKEAENVGYVLSEKQLTELGKANDAFDKLNLAVTGLKNQVAAVFAPAVTEFVNGLTGVVAFAAKSIKDSKSDFDIAVEDITEKIDATIKKFDGINESYEKTISGIETDTAAAKKLADTIFDLAGKTDLTQTEELKLYGALNAINKLIPGLNLEYDKQSGKLNKTRGEVDKLTTAYKNQAVEAAIAAKGSSLMATYAELYMERIEAERKISESVAEYGQTAFDTYTKRVEEAQAAGLSKAESYVAAYNGLIKQFEQTNPLTGEVFFVDPDNMMQAYENLMNLYLGLESTENALVDADEAIQTFNEDAEAARTELGLNIENIEAATDATEEATSATIDFSDELEEEAEELTALQQELKAFADATGQSVEDVEKHFSDLADAYAEAYKAAESSITGQTGLFAELTGESEVTAEKMLSNLLQQNDVIKQWTEDIKTLTAAGLEQGLIDQLISMGPSAAQAVRDMAKQVEDENNTFISDLNGAYRDQLDIKTAFAETMAESETGFVQYAQNLGVSSEVITEELGERGVSAGKAYGEGLNAGMDETNIDDNAEEIAARAESNKAAYQEAGKSAVESYTAGQKEALETAKTDIDTALADIELKFSTSQTTIGEYGTDSALDYLANLYAELISEEHMTLLQSAVDDITGKFEDAVTPIGDAGTDSATDYVSKMSTELAKVDNMGNIAGKLNAYVNMALDRKQGMTAAGENMANGLIDGLTAKLANRKSEVEAAVASIAATINNVMKIHSPSKVTEESGAYIGEGLIGGIVDAISGGIPEITAELGDMTSALTGLTMYDEKPAAPISYASDFSGIRSDIAALARAISDWQIVLDDGTLVGRMSDKVDAYIGETVGYKARRI